jgi:hypothetical protein
MVSIISVVSVVDMRVCMAIALGFDAGDHHMDTLVPIGLDNSARATRWWPRPSEAFLVREGIQRLSGAHGFVSISPLHSEFDRLRGAKGS